MTGGPWSVVVWDLDDTLVMERDFVRSGFRAVAEHLSAATGVGADRVCDFLWSGFEDGVRGDAFDRVHTEFAVTREVSVPEMVEVYRTHRPALEIPAGALDLMRRLQARGTRQAAITDGPLAGQRAKAEAVGLDALVDLVVFTDRWGRAFWKPHERAFLTVQDHFGVDGSDCVYVGDNPAKDFVAPRALGWGSIRLRRDGQLHSAVEDGTPAEWDVRGWDELAELLGVEREIA